MADGRIILDVQDLRVSFGEGPRARPALDGVSFSVRQGRTLAIVGESGCGKSLTALSIMRLLPTPPARLTGGRILFDPGSGPALNLAAASNRTMRRLRGKNIAMVFQEPMTALDPVYPIGHQIGEVLIEHEGLSGTDAHAQAVELLRLVGVPSPEERARQYPHEFSGGMRQRAVIAIALACQPVLLIADEPTTALDVTVQAQVLRLMRDIQERFASQYPVHHSRHGSGRADGGRGRRHVSRPSRRGRPRLRRPVEPRSPVFARPDRLDPDPRDATGPGAPADRRHGPADRIDQDGMPVSHTLSACDGDLPPGSAQDNNTGRQSCGLLASGGALVMSDQTGSSLLSVRGLAKRFPIYKGPFRRHAGEVHALNGVDLDIARRRDPGSRGRERQRQDYRRDGRSCGCSSHPRDWRSSTVGHRRRRRAGQRRPVRARRRARDAAAATRHADRLPGPLSRSLESAASRIGINIARAAAGGGMSRQAAQGEGRAAPASDVGLASELMERASLTSCPAGSGSGSRSRARWR